MSSARFLSLFHANSIALASRTNAFKKNCLIDDFDTKLARFVELGARVFAREDEGGFFRNRARGLAACLAHLGLGLFAREGWQGAGHNNRHASQGALCGRDHFFNREMFYKPLEHRSVLFVGKPLGNRPADDRPHAVNARQCLDARIDDRISKTLDIAELLKLMTIVSETKRNEAARPLRVRTASHAAEIVT